LISYNLPFNPLFFQIYLAQPKNPLYCVFEAVLVIIATIIVSKGYEISEADIVVKYPKIKLNPKDG
jgi:hypothetical protein